MAAYFDSCIRLTCRVQGWTGQEGGGPHKRRHDGSPGVDAVGFSMVLPPHPEAVGYASQGELSDAHDMSAR